MRSMLSSSPPNVAASFVAAARGCLSHSQQRSLVKQTGLFDTRDCQGRLETVASPRLQALLSYTRSLYGAGMGFDSLDILTGIVRASSGLRWDAEDALPQELAVIDADISQAIQSCREEYASGNVQDPIAARTTLLKLRAALIECRSEIEEWGGEFPFARGSANADCLHL